MEVIVANNSGGIGHSQGINGWLGLMALQFALGHQLSQLLINP